MLWVLKQGNFNIYKNLSKLPVKDIAKQQSETAALQAAVRPLWTAKPLLRDIKGQQSAGRGFAGRQKCFYKYLNFYSVLTLYFRHYGN